MLNWGFVTLRQPPICLLYNIWIVLSILKTCLVRNFGVLYTEVRIMKVKDQILKLRQQGYSYRQIQNMLGCSKGTIAYHCGENQKAKHAKRRITNRKKQHPLVRKIEYFNSQYYKPILKSSKEIKTLNRILRLKIETFSIIQKGVYNNMSFTVQEFLDKVGDSPSCALTGRYINLMKPATYQLDHIVPRSKGGSNDIDNCQLLSRDVNQAKHDLSVEEFINLCREVVNHFDNKNSERGI